MWKAEEEKKRQRQEAKRLAKEKAAKEARKAVEVQRAVEGSAKVGLSESRKDKGKRVVKEIEKGSKKAK